MNVKRVQVLVRIVLVRIVFAVVAATVVGLPAYGGVPLNNLQGAGGVAFNPLAYPAGQNKDVVSATNGGLESVLSKPQFGVWQVHLGDANVDWTSIGVAETLFDRLELSYAYELIAPNGENITKQDVGAKLLLLKESAGGHKFIPAVSVGAIWKRATGVATNIDAAGVDVYAVATKLITQLPWPVLLSGGVLSTPERVTGVFGADEDRDTTLFGNIDVLPLSNVAVGFEYKQGAQFDDFKNADYWDAHVAWIANKNLTLVAAYVNAGDKDSTSKVGLGDGVVVSAQYAF